MMKIQGEEENNIISSLVSWWVSLFGKNSRMEFPNVYLGT